MRRALPLLAVAALLAACADSSLPTDPEGPQLRAAKGPPVSCSSSDVRQSASALFGNSSAEVEIAKLITSQNAGSAVATNAGFDLMAAVAALRGSTPGWTAAQSDAAAQLGVRLLLCMDVAASGPVGAADFVAALSADGTYQVRGGDTDPTGNVLSWDAKAGVKPPQAFATWLGGRALFLGHPMTTFATEISGGYAYDWSTVRAIPRPATAPAPLTEAAIVALCADDAPDGLTGAELRVQHLAKAAGGVILPIAAGDFVDCETSIAAARGTPSSFAARLVHRLAELVRPAPLFASAIRAGGIGGLSTSFSPYEIVFPGTIRIAFGAAPANGRANSPIRAVGGGEITVLVTGAAGTPWQDIAVRITGIVNNGGVALCGNEAATDAAGIAHFPNLTANKAGGLYLVATTVEDSEDPDVLAYSTATTTSAHFNLKNSNGPSPC